jgi:hypothetical protein
MTDDEELARKYAHSIGPCDFGSTEAIKVFATVLRQVRADEREACALTAENVSKGEDERVRTACCYKIAKAIREKGGK